MIKKTVPMIENPYTAYLEGFQGVAWCLDLELLVEVWADGSWKMVPPQDYSRYIDWDEK